MTAQGLSAVPAIVAVLPVGSTPDYSGGAIIVLVGLHAAAAPKHHYIDKDAVLRSMLGRQG